MWTTDNETERVYKLKKQIVNKQEYIHVKPDNEKERL